MERFVDSFSDEALANYTPSEFAHLLIRNEDGVPRRLIDECSRRANEMLDELAAVLEKHYYRREDSTIGEWWLLLRAVKINTGTVGVQTTWATRISTPAGVKGILIPRASQRWKSR